MTALIACEFSGIVRDAFLSRGYDAVSCDLLPSERPGPHLQTDVLDVIEWSWSLIIAFPPCTHLALSGMRWFNEGKKDLGLMERALSFFCCLLEAPAQRVAVENPVGIVSTIYRKPDQIIQPWQFGHPEQKKTCLWLRNLPPLRPSKVLSPPFNQSIWKTAPSPDRWKIRSRTFQGVADAMADQWGSHDPALRAGKRPAVVLRS